MPDKRKKNERRIATPVPIRRYKTNSPPKNGKKETVKYDCAKNALSIVLMHKTQY